MSQLLSKELLSKCAGVVGRSDVRFELRPKDSNRCYRILLLIDFLGGIPEQASLYQRVKFAVRRHVKDAEA